VEHMGHMIYPNGLGVQIIWSHHLGLPIIETMHFLPLSPRVPLWWIFSFSFFGKLGDDL